SDQRQWIAETVDRQLAGSSLGLGRPGVVWRLGEPLALVRRPVARTALRGGELHVPEHDAAPAIERWYRAEARRVAEAAIATAGGSGGAPAAGPRCVGGVPRTRSRQARADRRRSATRSSSWRSTSSGSLKPNETCARARWRRMNATSTNVRRPLAREKTMRKT